MTDLDKCDKFSVRYGVIAKHFGKDKEHTFPQEIRERLPEALLNPFAITKYYEDTKKQTPANSYTLHNEHSLVPVLSLHQKVECGHIVL